MDGFKLSKLDKVIETTDMLVCSRITKSSPEKQPTKTEDMFKFKDTLVVADLSSKSVWYKPVAKNASASYMKDETQKFVFSDDKALVVQPIESVGSSSERGAAVALN